MLFFYSGSGTSCIHCKTSLVSFSTEHSSAFPHLCDGWDFLKGHFGLCGVSLGSYLVHRQEVVAYRHDDVGWSFMLMLMFMSMLMFTSWLGCCLLSFSSLSYYSLSSMYVGNWFQDPLHLPKSAHTQVLQSALGTQMYKKLAFHIRRFQISPRLHFPSASGWKKYAYNWTRMLQTCVVQASAVFSFCN